MNKIEMAAVLSKKIEWGSHNIGDKPESQSSGTEFLNWSQFWIPYVLTPILFLIGVICNFVSIKIFAKRAMRSSTNIYMMALSVSDLLYNVFSFTLSWKYYDFMGTIWLYWMYTPFGLWLCEASSVTSIWIITICTAVRYIGVRNPLNRLAYGTIKRATCLSITVSLSCFLIIGSFSSSWRDAIEPTEENPLNETVYILESTEGWKEKKFQNVYNWISTLIFYLLPIIIVAKLNYSLVQFARTNGAARQIMTRNRVFAVSQQQLNENQITITVAAVGITYIISQLPTLLLAISTNIYKPTSGSNKERILFELRNIFHLIGSLNSACNILLHIRLNRNYRKYFCAMCCRQTVTNFDRNTLRYPRVCYRRGFHPADAAVEVYNNEDGRY